MQFGQNIVNILSTLAGVRHGLFFPFSNVETLRVNAGTIIFPKKETYTIGDSDLRKRRLARISTLA